jgi:hypothetical protein
LTRAILTRDVREDSPRAWIIAEEWQEALGAHQAEQWGRLLSLARFKRTAVWSLNQAPAQIAAVSPTLLKLLRTNVGLEMIFRSSFEDAAVLAPLLATPSEEKSARETREALTREIVRLPRRSFYLHVKDLPCSAQLVRSLRIDLDRLRVQAAAVSPEVTRAIRRGTVASPREELERLVRPSREAAVELHPIDDLPPMPASADQGPAFPRLG